MSNNNKYLSKKSQNTIPENDDLMLADEDDALILADEEDNSEEFSALLKTTETGEIEAVIHPTTNTWKVMIVDDEADIHQVIQLVLKYLTFQDKPLTFLSAHTALQAKSLLENHPDIALIFLDVVMENNDSGLQLVKYIRDTLNNSLVRIVLHTGQPGEAPEKSVIADYDINDYKLKSEMTDDKLFVTTMVGLRNYRDLMALKMNQASLTKINGQLQREIEERQKIEHELRKQRDHLEEQVAKRTADLARLNLQLLQDIAKRKLAEEELRKFSRAVEQSANTIIITDLNGHIQFVNPAFSRQTGYASDEVIGKNIRLLKSNKYPSAFYKKLWDTITKGQVWQGELLNQHKSGELFWNSITISPIKNKSGQTTHYLSINRDITERKRTEAELLKSKELADSANQAKTAFLTNMSHELRTPLTAILGYAQLLKQDKRLTDEQREGIQIIYRSGEHLLTLISDILDLSKIEAGQLELMKSEFRFPRVFENIMDLFHIRAEQKGIELVYEPLSELPRAVHGDRKRLRQILLNLVGNAVKFTKTGQVTLKVQYTPSLENKNPGKIRVDVEDSGTGIAAENLDKIFLPFQQVGDRLYSHEGTGLGLSITKTLVEMMDGQLQVESTLGMGSHFWFEMPIQVHGLPLYEPPQPKTTIIGFKWKPTKGSKKAEYDEFKILIVDDQWENRVLLRNILLPLGFDVSEAEDGQVALTQVEVSQPDAIIMDLKMPVMDGLECTQRLRQDARFRHTVIIALTANLFDHNQQKSLEVGCNAFLTKPIKFDILLQTLANLCPIEWIYEASQNENLPVAKSPSVDIISPSKEQLNYLLKATYCGDVDAIIHKAQALLENEPKLQPFVEEICQLADDFQIKKIRQILQQYLQ
jgi:PAS domain S-box-containing protein